MEKLTLPTFATNTNPPFYITVPKGILPMDIYTVCTSAGIDLVPQYGWLTSRGRYLNNHEAVKFAINNGLVDKLSTHLSIEDFLGEWLI